MKKRTIVLRVLTLFCLESVYGQTQVFEESLRKNQERFRQTLTILMEKLEAKTSLEFLAKAPEVRFSTLKKSVALPTGFIGEYNPETNTICLDRFFELCNLDKITRTPDLADTLLRETSIAACGSPYDMRDILCHELGHYYVDLLIELKFPESWLAEPRRNKQTELYVENQMGIPIINEGIAMYFGKALSSVREPSFREERWKRKYYEKDLLGILLRELLIYDGGYSLVKPIIDLYGERGVEYLVSHPLEIKLPDFSNAPLYRNRALEFLSNEK